MRMVLERPAYVAELPLRREPLEPERLTGADLVSTRCISCHTLERVHRYKRSDWERVVERMRAYGSRLTEAESEKIVTYLKGDKPEAGTD
jgi:mono/diheme cytochrome c family protein